MTYKQLSSVNGEIEKALDAIKETIISDEQNIQKFVEIKNVILMAETILGIEEEEVIEKANKL